MAEWLEKKRADTAAELEIRGKKIPKVIVQILKNRGYDTPEKIEDFFDPSLSKMHNPLLIPNMEKAIERIMQAKNKKEKILIHGDYDVDGITGVALLMQNFSKLGIAADYFIPRRLIEGYGLSMRGLEYAVNSKYSLIITVDCGITAVSEIGQAKKNDIDVIVCDHHKPKEELPDACALVNPKLAYSNYPFKELAGVGVAFKMLHALYTKMDISIDELYDDLDLVALGTVADVVPLVEENRSLVKFGIKKILKSRKVGFHALLEEAGLTKGLTSYHLGFRIGPRINACGRLRDAKEALMLFLTKDKTVAMQIVRELSVDNQNRQQIEELILSEAKGLIEEHDLAKDRIIILGKESWHEGVIGIVASKISEAYARPTILLAMKREAAKGSGRSVSGFDITEALHACQNLLIRYGGHKQAAGLEIKADKVDELRQCINQFAQGFNDKIFMKKYYYDLKLDLKDITSEVVYFLKFFEPTGMENPQPVFFGENFEIVGVPRVVGNNHLKFAVRKEDRVIDAIAFEQAEGILKMVPGKTRIDCLYSVSEDSFIEKRKVILKIKDMRTNLE